jgi:hypothetical protein
MNFQEQQTASDKALNLGKSLYNGYMSVPRGVLRGFQAVRDYNEVMLNEEAPDRMQADEGFKNVLDEAANAEFLQPYNVRADSSAERFVYDLAQGAGQLGGQATVGVLTGGYGTLPAMALQIGGEEYKELRDAGVDVKTAAEAGAFNAAVQTPLEYIGFSKLMKRFPGNTMLRQRVRKVAEDVFTEGFTEFLQEFPEQASKIWAENADGTEKDASQIAREIFQTMWDHAGEILPGATYSGVIGGLLGGGAGSLHLAIDNRMERSVERAMQREVYNEMTEHVESTVNRIKESGVNPQYAAAVVNDNMQNQNVYVDGEALYGYAQEKGIEKVAESLGVSVEDIEKAAADSDTVDIKLGNYEATGAAFDGFLDAVKDDTAFEDGGYTVNKDKQEQAWAAAKKQQDDAMRNELDRIENEMKEATKAAGIKADVTNEMMKLLARARMWDNPVDVLKKLSFRYGESAEGYGQFAGENAETADKVKLAEAQQMEESGAAADEIYKKTGWFKGLDNKWRFEIKDNLNDVDLSGLKKLGELPLARVYYNADLFDAYPILRTVKVNIDPNMEESTYGQADVFDLVITLNENHLDEERMPSTVVHEVAHMIQKIEGFAAGGSAEDIRDALKTLGRYKQEYDSIDDYDLYLRIGGEQEAREVMRRARLEQYIVRAQERYEEAQKSGDEEEIRRKLFAKTMLERKRNMTPTPHTSDAVIVFDGEDMPYAYDRKQDEGPAGEKTAAEKNGRSNQSGFSYAQNRKGDYNPATNIITLFKGADASTVIHETWHFFVEQMWQTVQDGSASEQTVKDFETLLNYAGMTMEEWAAADVDGRRKAHEKLAEAGETYIMEGNAPSHELRRVFTKFAQWLRDVYRTLQRSENYAEITDEVREVFDRMLAAEDDIAEMERINGYFANLPDVITENMSDATRAKVENYIAKAREKAVYILTRRALKDYSKKRREEVKKFKEEIRPRVEEEVSKRPVYACGYDKADAARFRMLQDQQAGAGIWTAEDFINRAFAADVSKIENEVANYAAVANPKNWKKGLADVRKGYEKKRDEIIQPALDILDKGMGQGVETIRETNEYGEAKGDIVGRVSNNAQWYRDFYAEHKRKPTKAELQEMARQLISGDSSAPQIEGWVPTSAEEAQAMAEEGKRLADIERRIEACDAIKDRLAKLNENYNETSAVGSELFLLEANMTAERFGYSSADEMMKDVEQSPTKAKAVNQRINEIVAEMSPENEKANYEAAIRESLYNEDEALLIGVEQQLIEEYARRANEQQETQEQKKAERKINADVAAARKQQAKNLARADLAKMNMKEATRTSKFITAERNAAVKSAQLLAKKKFDEALTQKNLQAYWHAMAAESIKIARRQKQYEKFIKKQVKLKPEAWLNETHFAAISKLFERMNIARSVHREAAAQAQFETLNAYAAAMKEQFDCVDIAPWILDGTIPIDDTNALTLEQYEDVVNAIKNIKAIVKAQKGVNTFNRQETWENTKALMMEKLSNLKTIWTPNPNKPTKATAMERFTASMETLDSFLEYLDDATYGWFSQAWGNMIKRSSDKEYDYREQYDKADADALKKWLPDEAAEKAANEEIYYDELGTSVTKHTLVKMLINLGNKENSQRLCETVPVGFEKSNLWIMPDELTNRQTAADMTRQNLIDFLGRVLTKKDVEYAQRKIDAAEMFWGEKNELEKRVKGFGLKKVEATPVELTINGESVVFRGGYFPLMRNGETGSHASNAEVKDDDPLQGRNIRTYHTNTSATEARTNARYPVNLFPGAETQWIYESIHDLCWRETMNDFRRVLNDQELFATLKSKVGVARMQVFKEMLEVCADPQGNSKSMSEFEKLLGDQISWLRQRTSHAVIMLNLKVIAQNYANSLLYGNAIEGYTMADNLRALGTYMLKYHLPESHKEMVDFVFSKSSFLRERCELPDITVRDIVDEKKEFAWEKFFREVGIKAMAMTDNATAIPNWLTAYNKKLNEGATEQAAIDYADALVRRVLGSSRITDVSSMQRARAYKVFTMFQSFFNARYNEFLRMERLASKQWTMGQKQEAFANVCSYVLYKWLGQTMLAMALALQNPLGIDDEDKWPEIIKELKSYSFSMLGPVGQLGNAFAGAIAGMHEYTYRMSAIESTIENVNRSIKRIHSDKASPQDKAEGVINTATMLVGVPNQLNRIFWNAVDILFNNMSPEFGDIMRRRPKNERKK